MKVKKTVRITKEFEIVDKDGKKTRPSGWRRDLIIVGEIESSMDKRSFNIHRSEVIERPEADVMDNIVKGNRTLQERFKQRLLEELGTI